MGFGKLLKGVSKVVSSVAKVGNIPIVGNVVKAIPGVGTAVSLAGAGYSAYNLAKGFTGGAGGGAGLPALPGSGGAGLPALPGTSSAPPIVGDRSWWRDDPNIAAALKAWAISAHNLKTSYRSPVKGYVVVRDVNGDPYALPKAMAKKYAGYRESKKPPVSVGEWEAIKRADRATKRVKKMMSTIARVDNNIRGGKVVIKKRKKVEA